MKRTFLLAAVILAIAVAFNFVPQKAVSQNGNTGTIMVCLAGSVCVPPSSDTYIQLWNANGLVGSCTLSLGTICCGITGDFPTGKYTIKWSQDKINWCSTPEFTYKNGTSIEEDVICPCGGSRHK